MTYNAKQGLQAVAVKRRRMLLNDVIFRKKKSLNKRRLIDCCLREVLLK